MQTQTESVLDVPNYQNLITPPIKDTYDGITNFVRALFGEVYKEKKISKGQIIKAYNITFKHIGEIPFVQSLTQYGIKLDSLEIKVKYELLKWDSGIERDISSLLSSKKRFVILVDLQSNSSTFLRAERLYQSDKIIVLLIGREELSNLYELYKRHDFNGFDVYLQGVISRITNNSSSF